MTIRVLLCQLALSFACSCSVVSDTNNAQHPIKFYPEGSKFISVGKGRVLQGFAAREFERFRQLGNVHQRYFGAFAVSASGRHWWVGNYHSVSAANVAALKRCRKEAAQGCVVIGNIVPAGYKTTVERTVSERAATAFRKYQHESTPKAFALGTTNNYASTYKSQTIETARRRALANCSREFGLSDGKRYEGGPCRIIAEER